MTPVRTFWRDRSLAKMKREARPEGENVLPVDDSGASRREVEDLYNAIGEFEWLRLERDGAARVAYEIHARFLRRHIVPGSRILEIGAGPGRFTIELAKHGCDVVVSDLSKVQLVLNERHVREAGCEYAVLDRLQLDVCDLGEIPDGEFDGVVAYGGPLSYVFGNEELALRECLRVVRRKGLVLASVMSLAGSGRKFFDAFPPSIDAVGLAVFDEFLSHGDQRAIERGTRCAPMPALHLATDARARRSEWRRDRGRLSKQLAFTRTF